MPQTPSRRSPMRGCLTIALGLVAVLVVILAWMVWRMGGITGFEREVLTKGAVSGVEQHVLKHRPDGVADEEIQEVFERVRDAVSERRADLDKLYDALRRYQEDFKASKRRPSDAHIRALLAELDACVLPELPTD